jgi:1,4-dihydroxy-2-naphthoate polyprenyltransferase
MLLQKSTIQLLRLPFSFFLMPVYWFALGQVVDRDLGRSILIFIILHALVYPASNGYNSYMDRDSTPIGGVEHPLQPTRQLFRITLFMDMLALLLGFFISFYFVAGLAIYILASRAYSYRGIRLKKYPVAGYLTVITCQGALVFFIVYQGCHVPADSLSDQVTHLFSGLSPHHEAGPGIPANPDLSTHASWEAMLASSLLIGGFYPLTQLYQHEADRKDGVTTISLLLGYKGSFIFSGLMYAIAFLVLAYYFISSLEIKEFYVLATCLLPVSVYFFIWAGKVWKDPARANFSNTMIMNRLASLCANAGFIAVILMGSYT